MTPLTAISLFSGIGGLDIAARAAGFRVAAHVEINPYRRWILSSHREYWHHAKTFTDIKTFGVKVFPSGTGCDLVFGGFPCQDVSQAGDRAGLGEGTRSGLWSEFRRVIGEFRPRCVLVENVAGLRSLGGTQVLADLAKLGYVGQWGSISAADAGASHQRERVFIVGYASQTNGKECHVAAITEGAQPGQPGRADSRSDVEYAAPSTGAPSNDATSVHEIGKQLSRNTDRNRSRTRISTQSRSERGMGGNADGLSARLDAWQGFAAPIGQPQYDYEPERVVARGSQPNRTKRLEALGDGVVPIQAFPIFYHLYQRLCAERVA